MRKFLGRLMLCLAMSFSANSVFADSSKFYYGAGVSQASIKVKDANSTSMSTVTGTFGLKFKEYLGLEFEIGSASDDTQSIISESQVSYGSVMLRVGRLFERVGVYGSFGHAYLDSDSKYEVDEFGYAMGFGVNIFGNATTSFNFHFLRLDEGGFTSATIGFQHYLGGFR